MDKRENGVVEDEEQLKNENKDKSPKLSSIKVAVLWPHIIILLADHGMCIFL